MKGYAPRRVTNFRDDKARSSGMWRQSFEQRRCLVPTTSFCEPNDGRAKGEKATWHWFALKGAEPRTPFALAGIWRTYTGPVKKDGPSLTQDVSYGDASRRGVAEGQPPFHDSETNDSGVRFADKLSTRHRFTSMLTNDVRRQHWNGSTLDQT